MFTPDELTQLKGSYDAFTAGQSQGKTKVVSTKPTVRKFGGLKGFLVNNAPTIGGAIGTVAGLPLNALDAVSGVGGTALNVAAAGGGTALGQRIKNHFTGEDESTLKQGVLGAAGEGVGLGATKLLAKTIGKAGSALSSAASKSADNKLAADTTQQLADEVSPFHPVAKGHDVRGAIDLMKSHNMAPDIPSMKSAANFVTGDKGELNAALRQILGGNGGSPVRVDVGNYLNHVKDAINGEPLLGMAEARTGSGAKLMTSITKNKEENLFGDEGSLTQGAKGNDVLDAIQYHEKQAARLKKSAPGTEGEAIGNVHKRAADYLDDQLSKNAGADRAVGSHKIDPDDAQSILDRAKAEGISPQLAQKIVNIINDSKSVADLRGAQSPFVRASQLARSAEDHAQGKGYADTVAQEAKTAAKTAAGNGEAGDVLRLVTNAAVGSHMGVGQNAGLIAKKSGVLDRVTGKGASINSKASKVNQVGGKLPGGIADTIGGLIGQSAVVGGNNTSSPVVTDATNTTDSIDQTNPLGLNEDGTFGDNTLDKSSEPEFGKTELVSALQSDPKNANTYISLYKLFNDDSTSKMSASQQKAIAATKQAGNTFDQIESTYKNAGGGQGRIGGLINNLLGKAGQNDQTKAYNDTAVSLGASLYKALGNTGTITDNDQKRIAGLIPKTTDTPGEAQIKINQLKTLLQEAQDNVSVPVNQ